MPDTNEPRRQPSRRSRSRHAGSITSYASQGGQRWKFQIYVPNDPERPEHGDTRGGFTSLDEAQRGLAEARRKKKSNGRFQAKPPPSANTPNTGSRGCACRAPPSRATRRSSATTSRPTSAPTGSTNSPRLGSRPITASWRPRGVGTGSVTANRSRPTLSRTSTSSSARCSMPLSMTA